MVMNVLLCLLIAFVVYGLFELIKSCTRKEESAPSESFISKGIRFTHDRQDPDGYERHEWFGVMNPAHVRKVLEEEGFCKERIDRFFEKNLNMRLCYGAFLI